MDWGWYYFTTLDNITVCKIDKETIYKGEIEHACSIILHLQWGGITVLHIRVICINTDGTTITNPSSSPLALLRVCKGNMGGIRLGMAFQSICEFCLSRWTHHASLLHNIDRNPVYILILWFWTTILEKLVRVSGKEKHFISSTHII